MTQKANNENAFTELDPLPLHLSIQQAKRMLIEAVSNAQQATGLPAFLMEMLLKELAAKLSEDARIQEAMASIREIERIQLNQEGNGNAGH